MRRIAADRTEVTVIAPVRNEVAAIESCIFSLARQKYSAKLLQILVIDGQSVDGTLEKLAEIQERLENTPEAPQIRIITNPDRIVPAALNLGLEHASGRIIFRLDGHSLMRPDYIRRCVETLEKCPEVDCVGGPSRAVGEGPVGTAYAAALRSPFGVGGGTFRTAKEERFVDTIAFGAYRREVFEKVGRFDPELHRNQDIEFNARLRKQGGKLLLITDTWTEYLAPSNLKAIIRQNFYNGFWNTCVLHKMWPVLSWRHFAPLMMVLAAVVLGVAAFIWFPAIILLALATLAYILMSIFYSLREYSRLAGSRFFLLLMLFPLMHLSYGIASLTGLIAYAFKGLKSSLRIARRASFIDS